MRDYFSRNACIQLGDSRLCRVVTSVDCTIASSRMLSCIRPNIFPVNILSFNVFCVQGPISEMIHGKQSVGNGGSKVACYAG